ncbi:hypothetical protein GCM10007315_13690 [Gemmobacter tilapiae]|uniref:Uncharacterized protein n=1 Tax=Neogemmobacter tilapiae TaxID=875041 RepID=A0A918TQJ0_9RHOB|nr:hypothetical protein GCM10007315_13690 [Gemmobacter tilapiae]
MFFKKIQMRFDLWFDLIQRHQIVKVDDEQILSGRDERHGISDLLAWVICAALVAPKGLNVHWAQIVRLGA